MPRLEDLPDLARQGMLNFPAFDHDDAPCAVMSKPLTEAKIALVTTAGLVGRDEERIIQEGARRTAKGHMEKPEGTWFLRHQAPASAALSLKL